MQPMTPGNLSLDVWRNAFGEPRVGGERKRGLYPQDIGSEAKDQAGGILPCINNLSILL